jgi:hypothetical protein
MMASQRLERAKGIEPSTYSLGSCRSTTELRPRSSKDNANMGRGKAGTTGALALRRACFTLATISDRVSVDRICVLARSDRNAANTNLHESRRPLPRRKPHDDRAR